MNQLMNLLLVVLLCPSAVFGQLASLGAYNVIWSTPTVEVDGFFAGGMPLGNGDVQVLAWANVTAGGVSIYVSKQDAIHSDTLLYKVALLTLSVSPNPYLSGPFFEQSLDLASATVFVKAGGKNASNAAATFAVWVDAHSNTGYAFAEIAEVEVFWFIG